MLFRLSWKNFKAQFLNYSVYFISMIFAVMVYYCFSAIKYNKLLVSRAGKDIQIEGAMTIGRFLIIAMVLGFMIAANHFFLLKRNKEIEIYYLIGIRKIRIAFLFFIENLLLGSASLLAGIFLGMIFSKLFLMILAKAMFLDIESVFRFSAPSILQTSTTFLFMFLVITMQTFWIIYRYRLNHHTQFQKKMNWNRIKISRLDVGLSVLGVLSLALGYIIALNLMQVTSFFIHLKWGILSFLIAPLLTMLFCTLGSYLFFKYSIFLILHRFSRCKSSYYHSMNMIIVENTKQHLKKNSKSLFMITSFITIALATIGGTTSFYTLGMDSVNVTSPVDFIADETSFSQLSTNIQKETGETIDSFLFLEFKVVGGRYNFKIGQDEQEATLSPINLLSYSNYQAYQKINSFLKPLTIKKENDVILFDSLKNIVGGMVNYGDTITFQNGVKVTVTQVSQNYLGDEFLRYDFPTIVVSDQMFDQMQPDLNYRLIAFNIANEKVEHFASQLENTVTIDWVEPIYYHYERQDNQVKGYASYSKHLDQRENEQVRERLNYTNRFLNIQYERRIMGLILYVILFLGIISLFITGSILMLQQFSEAENEQKNYELLKKIGIPNIKITKLIYQQIGIIFFLPMVLAILHAIVAVIVFSTFISSSGYWLAYVVCGFFILIYLGYFFLTSAIYCRIIHAPKSQ